MSDGSGFIDGVYNYCDRWCERCPLTSRCRLFADEQELREKMARSDQENADFWNTFDEMTEEALALDEEESWEGFDAVEESKQAQLDELTERDPLVQVSRDYALDVHGWLQKHEADFPSQENRFRAARDAVTPAEALEVIAWHHFQINVKLARATQGRLEAEAQAEENGAWEPGDWDTGSPWKDEDEAEEDIDLEAIHLHDANGSARVALLGIERSIGAWTILRDAYPQEDAQIQDFQRRLAGLRRMLDAALPDARSFRRPGFGED